MKSKIRQFLCVGLTGVMLSTFIAGNALAFAKDGSSVSADGRFDTVNVQNITGKLDLTDIAVSNFNSSVINAESSGVTVSENKNYKVIVTLEQTPIIGRVRSNGTVKEYLSTAAGIGSQNAIKAEQKKFLSELSSAGIKHTVINSYNTVTNSVVLSVKGSDITKIKGASAVKSVVMASYYDYPQAADTSAEKATSATSNPNDVYKTGIYNSSKYVKGETEAGVIDGGGVSIAILDTGLDYTHPAFNVWPTGDAAIAQSDVATALTDTEAYRLSSERGEAVTVNDLYLNKKVPFAYDYADKDANVYPSYSQHGTHVAGIAAGNGPSNPADADYGYTDKDGNHVNEQFVGVAPNAQLVICKVFTDDFDSADLGGANTEDILAALDDCVTLGVDVINMSLGTSAGFSSIEIDGDTEGAWMNEVYASIRDAGINLVCAASNEYSSGYGSAFGTNLAANPDSGTVGSPSTFTGAMSTASINGQQSYYMNVNLNDGVNETQEPIFFTAASDANYVRQDFLKLLGVGAEPQTFRYVVISGTGTG
ncbi:MAG: S8 family serine peptidase, partial [Ruminococcus flavefaciens]|nr:S8 family serine peptidase [Ruminococcus flavefaciens]